MKIGLFLGSFNPIHSAHIAIAKHFTQRLLDQIWFVVTPQNRKKSKHSLVPVEHRMEMLKLALAPYSAFLPCDTELSLSPPYYSYHTITALKIKHPHETFYLILGEDNFLHFNQWYRYKDILREVELLNYPRNVESSKSSKKKTLPTFPISATEIRDKIKKGATAISELEPQVFNYIKSHGLYM